MLRAVRVRPAPCGADEQLLNAVWCRRAVTKRRVAGYGCKAGFECGATEDGRRMESSGACGREGRQKKNDPPRLTDNCLGGLTQTKICCFVLAYRVHCREMDFSNERAIPMKALLSRYLELIMSYHSPIFRG